MGARPISVLHVVVALLCLWGTGWWGGGVERGGIDTVEDDSEHWPKDLIGPIADYIKFCPYTSLW